MSIIKGDEDYYEYKSDIDLDAQTLFDYVNQQFEVYKAINNVVPAKPETFGLAMEPFESNKTNVNDAEDSIKLIPKIKKQREETNYFKWIIFILLFLLALYFLFHTKTSFCGKDKQSILGNNYIENIDTYTPAVGSEFRAMFVR